MGPMAQEPDTARTRDLDERIAAARSKLAPRPRADEHYSRAQTAWRMVIELVAGLLVGFGLASIVPAQQIRVQFIHASANAESATIDVYLDGQLWLDDVAYATATPFED